MNFFEAQEDARRRTALLVGLFALAVGGVTAAVYAVVSLLLPFLWRAAPDYRFWDMERMLWTGAVTLAVILGGSLYKSAMLRAGGGPGVAESLGGRRIMPNSDDFLERRLLNVVEEMAIASGVPAPPVFLLEDAGINAFAVGFSPRDAAIGVTRGAMELLSREQLQGVIAHEFSHLLNGDTLIKMRLMGLLFGIMLVSDAGMHLLSGSMRLSMARRGTLARRQGGGAPPALMLLGFLLFLAGLIGMVLADLIKRAVSRQREFLADAAAVQFTRNPEGLAGALKIIGGYKQGGRIVQPAAHQASHLFFCNALSASASGSWWATHPPLAERIRRLDPSFRGRLETVDAEALAARVRREVESPVSMAVATGGVEPGRATAEGLADRVGAPGPAQAAMAREMLARIPESLRRLAREPHSARAMAYALLLSGRREVRKRQLALLRDKAPDGDFDLLLDLESRVSRLEAELRLPLAQVLLPALECQSRPQYRAFRDTLEALIRADGRVSLFEYGLRRILLARMDATFGEARPPEVRHEQLAQVLDAARVLLGTLAWAGARDEAGARHAFARGMRALAPKGGGKAGLPERKALGLRTLDAALDRWEFAAPALKKRLLEAAAACVMADGRAHLREMELLRVFAASLDCPMPPLPGAPDADEEAIAWPGSAP